MAVVVTDTVDLGLPTYGWNGSAWVVTVNVTLTAGVDCLVIVCAAASSFDPTVTYDGVSVPQRIAASDGNAARIVIFSLSEPSTGSSLALTFNDGGGYGTFKAYAFGLTGTDISTATAHVEDTGSDTGYDTFVGVTLDPTVSGESMCLEATSIDGGVNVGTIGSDQTLIEKDVNFYQDQGATFSKAQATGSTQGMSWTMASMRNLMGAISIKAGAGGGSTPKGPLGHPFFGPFGGPIS